MAGRLAAKGLRLARFATEEPGAIAGAPAGRDLAFDPADLVELDPADLVERGDVVTWEEKKRRRKDERP